MIAHLRGAVAGLGPDHAVIDVGGVGYRCQVPAATRSRLSVGQEVLLHTSMQVREDSMTLYGFSSNDEFELFELLLRVESIGPKVALGVLSATTPESFRRAIAFEDVTSLCRIPGVGKKTAQRMVLELKEKVGALIGLRQTGDGGVGLTVSAPVSGEPDPSMEALEALLALGYSRLEAAQALEKARQEAGDAPRTELLVRLGLKYLFRG